MTFTLTEAQRNVQRAEQKLRDAQEELKKAQERAEFESSFGQGDEVYVLVRRDIDRGRLESILGIFTDRSEAERFANGTPGYGLNQDMYVQPHTLFVKRHDA